MRNPFPPRPSSGSHLPKLSVTCARLPSCVPFLLTRYRHGILVTFRDTLTNAQAVDVCLCRMRPWLLDLVVEAADAGDPRDPANYRPWWDPDARVGQGVIGPLERAGRLRPWPHRA